MTTRLLLLRKRFFKTVWSNGVSAVFTSAKSQLAFPSTSTQLLGEVKDGLESLTWGEGSFPQDCAIFKNALPYWKQSCADKVATSERLSDGNSYTPLPRFWDSTVEASACLAAFSPKRHGTRPTKENSNQWISVDRVKASSECTNLRQKSSNILTKECFSTIRSTLLWNENKLPRASRPSFHR